MSVSREDASAIQDAESKAVETKDTATEASYKPSLVFP
jgi:hypothetical protein